MQQKFYQNKVNKSERLFRNTPWFLLLVHLKKNFK